MRCHGDEIVCLMGLGNDAGMTVDEQARGNWRRSSLTVTAALAVSCVSLFQPPITDLKSVATIQGREVKVGYFDPQMPGMSGGDYVLVRRDGQRWAVQSVSGSAGQVPPGSEQLYVSGSVNGTLYVTPAFSNDTPIDRSDMHFNCDAPPSGYGPCDSALAMMTTPPLRRAGIDRYVVLQVLDEASVVEVVDAHHAQAKKDYDLARRYSDFCNSAKVVVERVSNAPSLVPLTAAEVAPLIALGAEPGSAAPAGPTLVTFHPHSSDYEASRPYGTIRCAISVDRAAHQVEFTGSNEAGHLPLSASVDRCSVIAPRPVRFVATDASKSLSIEIVSFDPERATQVSISNASDEFLTVSSISLYYFGKIITPEFQKVELPPHGLTTTPVVLLAQFPVSSTFEGVTRDNAAQKTFAFGLAAKFTRGSAGEATLLDERQVSIRDLLALETSR
jgi:hypothetical protein